MESSERAGAGGMVEGVASSARVIKRAGGRAGGGVRRLKLPKKPRLRDRFVDQWLVARGERLPELVTMALGMIEHVESYYATRVRRRRPHDAENLHDLVENLIANLAYAVIDGSGPATVAVSLSKRKKVTRYDRPIHRQLPSILSLLEQHDVLRITKSTTRARSTTIEATAWLRSKVEAARIGFDDFSRSEHEELIVLSRTERGFGADGSFGKRHRRIDYESTAAETRRYRSEMARINAFLAKADLEFARDAASQLHVDPRKDRTLTAPSTCPRGKRMIPRDSTSAVACSGRLSG
ncbi:MAG TPA: hypothetical protein VII91_04265 [Bauldia sp.]